MIRAADEPHCLAVLSQVGAAAAAQSVAGLRGCETGCVEAGQQVVVDFQPRDSLANLVCP